jgi:hypothetical protein
VDWQVEVEYAGGQYPVLISFGGLVAIKEEVVESYVESKFPLSGIYFFRNKSQFAALREKKRQDFMDGLMKAAADEARRFGLLPLPLETEAEEE